MPHEQLEAYFGLPAEVKFCHRCVMSNQRPCSYPEFKHTSKRKVPTLRIDEQGICDAAVTPKPRTRRLTGKSAKNNFKP